jgi:phosphate:Na+ symporter
MTDMNEDLRPLDTPESAMSASPNAVNRPNALLPCRPRMPFLSSALAYLLVCGFCMVHSAAQGNLDGLETSATDFSQLESSGSDSNEDSQANGNRKIAKLIPDQRAFIGTPTTVINLSDAFDNFAGTGKPDDGGKPWAIAVVHNSKPKVAQAKIDGTQLAIDWGQVGKTEITVRATDPATDEIVDVRFNARVWQPDYWMLALTVIGGLGIFLLGMKNMSEGLQAIAGSGLRRMISTVTDNRLMAVGVGAIVTTLVQSSSITTVMVIGFVNSGFMNLAQAVGVIMGANIGTTITGWILALKIGKYGLPILGFAIFGYLFVRNDRVRYTALAVMGLGMVFFGLSLMKDGFAMVKELPDFEAWFAQFDAGTYLGVLKCASVGCVLTFIVQSSSATLGITIGLASIGVIHFETAAALVLGENIGTTITAWLASFGATTAAKRAAYFHVLFNLIGVAWITAIFGPYIEFINYLLDLPFIRWLGGIEADPSEVISVTVRIAAVHTCFNLVNTILFLPFTGILAALLTRMIPQKDHKEKPHLTSLDIRMLETPVIAIEQSRVELLRMADGCTKMMRWLGELKQQEVPDSKKVHKLFHREEVLDTIQDEVVAFLSDMLAANLPHEVIDEGRNQLRIADELESISDYIASILKFHLKLQNQGHAFDQTVQKQIQELHTSVMQYLTLIVEGYTQRQTEIITKANSTKSAIKHLAKKLRNDHFERLGRDKIDPHVNVAFMATLNSYLRVTDHALNVAEAIAGVK